MNRLQIPIAAALAAAALAAAAHGDEQTDWGTAAHANAAHRTIRITMADSMRFAPAIIEVGLGETVKFEVHNAGKLPHEMVIGTKKELEEHAALMRKFPGMQHEDASMAHVPGGGTGRIAWTFNRPGTFEFACLVPGHYEAGMRGQIRVVGRHDHKH